MKTFSNDEAITQLSLDDMKEVGGGAYVTIGSIDGGACSGYERSLGGCRGGVGVIGTIRF